MNANTEIIFEDFKAYILSEYGLEIIGDWKPDGTFHYLGTTDDKKGKKPFRYCIHADTDDPANVYFNDLKRGFHGVWYPQGREPLTHAEREQRRRAIAAHQTQREQETQARHRKKAVVVK